MYGILKYLFFLLPPETAHYLAMDLLGFALRIPVLKGLLSRHFRVFAQKEVLCMGIRFPNMVGLAAGFDKDAKWLPVLKELGFGFVEVGTVTPRAQSGNDKPRLFRLKKDHALINRMGFNNEGVDAMVQRLQQRPAGLVVGANIGKNKLTPNEEAIGDYMHCLEKLYDHVDYIVVNVSSPNTPGLRELQEKGFLLELFGRIRSFTELQPLQKPVLLKIAPDLENQALDEIIAVLLQEKVAGIVATNTSISRSGLLEDKQHLDHIGAGGLSGRPLKQRSNEVIRYLRAGLGPEYPILGVGGIETSEDLKSKIAAGANLVQVYTGFIYRGPSIVRQLLATDGV